MAAWCLMTMCVMHGLAVKLCTVFCWTGAASWQSPVVAFARIEMMIDVSVKTIRSVKPGSRTYEHAACKPLGPIITVRGAVIRRYFVISVRTNRWLADTNRDLRRRTTTGSQNDANK
jgi:hypothetical protein